MNNNMVVYIEKDVFDGVNDEVIIKIFSMNENS